MTVQPYQTIVLSPADLSKVLEPMIRSVVREELARAMTAQPKSFRLKPDSPLYHDMAEILRRKTQGEIKLHSHAEVWGE
jgi:hypothetical protein